MKDFLSSLRFKILIAVLVVAAGFMIMAVYTGGTVPLVTQLVSFITVPIQRVSAHISDEAGEFFARFVNSSAVYDENERLRGQLNELRRQLADYEQAMHENEQFREILGVMENRQDLKVETAAVIARDPLDRFYSFTIDKGTLDSISVLDPVMTADGLVGYVYEVGKAYAKVVTIIDVIVDVGAYDSATRDIGIVSGSIKLAEQGLCQMEYLPRDSQIAPGDLILTSGGSLYPRDIVIGTVREVLPNTHGTSLLATIEPAAPIQSIKNVFVITHYEGQGEE